ncbi:MAG: AEC family transporter [Gammaproteobacteria bacterium]|jgi:malonate transporter and related proteins|nr:AEC family transporter [Gammaproteobacteria bacterium]
MALLGTILPVIVIALIGYFVRQRNVLSETESLGIEKVAFNFLIPCLLFNGTATTIFPEFIDWSLMSGFYASIFIVYLIGMLIGKIFFAYNNVQYSVFGMGGAYSNVTVIGIPFCVQAFGDEAFVPLFIIISTHNIIIFTFGTVIAEIKKESSTSILRHLAVVIKDLVSHPITGSLLAGIIVNLLNIPFHIAILNTLDLLALAASPLALFALGGALTRYKITGNMRATLTIVVMKLLILPTMVYLSLFHVFDIDPLWAGTAVLLSSMPTGIGPYVFSLKYRACESQIASAVVITAMLSVFTSSFFILLVT